MQANEDDADRQALLSESQDGACDRALPKRALLLMIDESTDYKANIGAIFQRQRSTDSPTRHASLQ